MKNITILICCLCVALGNTQDLELELFASGLDRPVNLKHAGDDRLFAAEQDGIIKIINADGSVNTTPFLDIEARVESGGSEEGLLGLAFHPNYATNGYFFVNYTRDVVGQTDNETVVSRFTRSSTDPSQADPNSELIILTYTQPFTNHNGGELQFGPDGYLYISSGDGGSGGDPQDNGQDLGTLLGKLLRIDVNNSTMSNPYAIPTDNPFIGTAGARGEIWAYGLRNPWKFSFDRLNDDIWIADVGQSAREEINNAPSTSAGLNYGWRCYEGNNTYNTSGCPPMSSLTFPVAEYAHSGGRCSITGGYRYRGSEFPGFNGLYFFADVCTQEIGYIEFENGTWNSTFEGFSGSLVAFGEDINGELYICSLGGDISKLVDNSLSTEDFDLNNVAIYPNPAENEITIDFSSVNATIKSEMTIFDLQGKIINSKNKSSDAVQKINTSQLSQGLYLLQIRADNGEQMTHKLVIQ
ncbi:PQQ-dependent sugar dehydrogenase [Winogradskyella ouciana]|uniref:T9SS type A sorting domain-containing protein n=1 Tax=Winogradskyella ouciana TaxID=2608631 RepID=A0A7K1GAA6_9FLAO|nr:PQQ-dependent sugar dehydrogenase [Winogradskyella ouciana]MTE25318.1 T9SS type A sorting domain-containing protein [Winogradskyella ouciana]